MKSVVICQFKEVPHRQHGAIKDLFVTKENVQASKIYKTQQPKLKTGYPLTKKKS